MTSTRTESVPFADGEIRTMVSDALTGLEKPFADILIQLEGLSLGDDGPEINAVVDRYLHDTEKPLTTLKQLTHRFVDNIAAVQVRAEENNPNHGAHVIAYRSNAIHQTIDGIADLLRNSDSPDAVDSPITISSQL